MLKPTLAALAATMLIAAPAAAAPVIQTRVVSVSFADLNLARSDHRAVLAKRVERAAKTACERPFIRDLSSVADHDACIANARDGAMGQIAELSGAPALAAN